MLHSAIRIVFVLMCLLCVVVWPGQSFSDEPSAGVSAQSDASHGEAATDGDSATHAAGNSTVPPDAAANPEADGETATLPPGLKVVDWLIIAAYGAITILMGWWIGRRQNSASEYFVGSGNMHPVLIGVSLFATLLSTISYLSMPGEMVGKGPVFLTSLFAFPFVYVIVGFVIIPVLMKQRYTSAYELLEDRLGIEVRLLGATMFVVLRIVWMSLLIYLTAKALSFMMGLGKESIPFIALIAGFVAVIYTSIGGLRAVVITDFMQSILLLGGALLVIGVVTVDLGGFSWFPDRWHPNWDTQPVFPLSPDTGQFDLGVRASILGSFLTYLVWFVCTLASDQTSVQRFMATTDARAARNALLVQLGVSVLVTLTLATVGFALLGYFETHPDQIPAKMDLKKNADDLFPHFIAYHLPVGISGLVVSAMFAAAMSSIDSGVNSITAVVMRDYCERFRDEPLSDRQQMLLARWLAFGIGALVVAMSSVMEYVPGNITSVTQKTSNLLTTPIFCLFFFALFVPFATKTGVLVGAVAGTIVAVLIGFFGPIFGQSSNELDLISFQWIAPYAVIFNIGVGTLVSLLTRARTPLAGPPPADAAGGIHDQE